MIEHARRLTILENLPSQADPLGRAKLSPTAVDNLNRVLRKIAEDLERENVEREKGARSERT